MFREKNYASVYGVERLNIYKKLLVLSMLLKCLLTI